MVQTLYDEVFLVVLSFEIGIMPASALHSFLRWLDTSATFGLSFACLALQHSFAFVSLPIYFKRNKDLFKEIQKLHQIICVHCPGKLN